jgi:hypothetical protein
MPFLALEFCGGGSLEKQLAGTPLPSDGSALLVETLARAMHVAHRAHVIHRDLKPANILLQEEGTAKHTKNEGRNGEAQERQEKDGQRGERPPASPALDPSSVSSFRVFRGFIPKIADFGLAKKLDEAGRTQTGAVMGTPPYMAPEQAAPRKGVGPAADVYALGAILYECLTGRPPFKAATPLDTVLQVLTEEPLPPSRLNRKVPRDLETVCLKCLEKDPGKRYASALALADDLGRFLAGRPVAARPTGPLGRTARLVRRRPALAALAAVSVLAAVGLLVTVLAYNARLQAGYERVARERDAAEEAARQEARAREEAHAARQTAEQALLESQRRLALNYFAYGRLCAVAARLATAEDRAKADEPLREFRKLERWLTRLGDEAVKPALADYDAALGQWADSGPTPRPLRQRALTLARACRKPWTDLIDRECPELANQVRGLLYARAVEAADELARAARPEDAARAAREFWELYWGEMVMVEAPAVEAAMARMGQALGRWQGGPAPAEVGGRAADLRRACRLPPPTTRRGGAP